MFNQTFKSLKSSLKRVFTFQRKQQMVSSKIKATDKELKGKTDDGLRHSYKSAPWWVSLYHLNKRPDDTSMYVVKSFGTASRIGKF
jgi:hypothetical protein